MDRPPPPITVSIPGRGEAPAELLAVGPPPPRRAPLPRALRLQAAAVVAVLGAGVAVAYERQTAPPPPPPPLVLPGPLPVAGVSAEVAVAPAPAGRPLVQPLVVTLRLMPSGGQGDSGGSPRRGQLALLELRARGFAVRLVGDALPLDLGDLDRLASGLDLQVPLAVEAVVTDCSTETEAPRRLALSLRRGDGPVGTVVVTTQPEVVRALDRLVSRTCRRPRG